MGNLMISMIVNFILAAQSHAFYSVQSENICPDLRGQYTCQAFNGALTIEIPVDQSVDTKGTTTYIIDEGPIVADGQLRTSEKLPNLMSQFVENVQYIAICQDQSVDFKGKGTVISSGENAEVTGLLTKMSDQHVQLQITYTSASDGVNEVTAECTK